MLRTHYACDIKPGMSGQKVSLAGWVHEVRDMGKVKFLILRDWTGLIQVTGKKGVTDDAVLNGMSLVKESVVSISGIVREEKQARGGVEINPTEILDLNPVEVKIPFEVTGKVPAELDVRLNHRHIDLRRIETSAIFKVKSQMLRSFRGRLHQLGFIEVNPPCIVSAATEGGTELFPVEYFERKVFLAQSPQLYKQLAVIGGIDKVFMTTPVFRAEKHNTTTHLNELISLDVEIGFADHNDAMNVLEDVMKHIISDVNESCPTELKLLGSDLKVPDEIKRHTYTSVVELLNEKGEKLEWGADFNREQELKAAELLGEEIFFITEWPTKSRAFYSMPDEKNPEICNAFDLMYGGMEIASGAQRIHLPKLLAEQLESRGLDPKDFEFYVNAFKMGAPPHAGWAIGAERLAMKLCNRNNIRECALFPRDRTRVTP
ncbi:MAG: aspartate--tRNA(Asn) ligase [Candidatus Micrarchaeota archaeon]|nr:aspartate--tRNA(Asn) ligase [Candidatus Micrarchaeota archaeon]